MRCILFCCCCCCCWSFKFLQTYFTGLTLIPWCTAGLYCIADWWVFSDDVQLGEKGTFTPKEIIFEQINGIKARVIARKLSETRWHHLNNLPNFFHGLIKEERFDIAFTAANFLCLCPYLVMYWAPCNDQWTYVSVSFVFIVTRIHQERALIKVFAYVIIKYTN